MDSMERGLFAFDFLGGQALLWNVFELTLNVLKLVIRWHKALLFFYSKLKVKNSWRCRLDKTSVHPSFWEFSIENWNFIGWHEEKTELLHFQLNIMQKDFATFMTLFQHVRSLCRSVVSLETSCTRKTHREHETCLIYIYYTFAESRTALGWRKTFMFQLKNFGTAGFILEFNDFGGFNYTKRSLAARRSND